jgi:hypothetical protein
LFSGFIHQNPVQACNLNIQSVKLILQITLGVFLGTMAAQLVIDYWHNHQQTLVKADLEKVRSERERVRTEQGERIRNLLLQSRQVNPSNKNEPEPAFVPDDFKKP